MKGAEQVPALGAGNFGSHQSCDRLEAFEPVQGQWLPACCFSRQLVAAAPARVRSRSDAGITPGGEQWSWQGAAPGCGKQMRRNARPAQSPRCAPNKTCFAPLLSPPCKRGGQEQGLHVTAHDMGCNPVRVDNVQGMPSDALPQEGAGCSQAVQKLTGLERGRMGRAPWVEKHRQRQPKFTLRVQG